MIPLDFEMLTDHAPFYPYELAEDLVFDLTMAPATDVIFRAADPGTRDYELTNIALEYETVRSEELGRAVSSTYLNGVTVFYDYVTFFKELTIPLNETLTNININVPRSYKGIVMLCFDADRNDSEEFKNCGVTDINITIEGLANKVYGQNLKLKDQWSEMTKYFPNDGPTVSG